MTGRLQRTGPGLRRAADARHHFRKRLVRL